MSNYFTRGPGLPGQSFLQLALLGGGLVLSAGSSGTSKNKVNSAVTIVNPRCSASRPLSLQQSVDRYSLSCRYNGGVPKFTFTTKQRAGNAVCPEGTHLYGVDIRCVGAPFDLKIIPTTRPTVSKLPTASEELAAMAKIMLDEHNRYRAVLKLNPLTWLDSLAKRADKWAVHLASLGGTRLVPSDSKATGQGENLWMGAAGKHDYAAIIRSWSKQKKHYMQMVGRKTTRIGCAFARAGGNDILVCRYWPPADQ